MENFRLLYQICKEQGHNQLAMTNKKIVYIDNFLRTHNYTPSIGELITNLLKQEGYNLVCTSNKKSKTARLLDMLLTIYRNRKNSIILISTYSTSAFYFAWLCSLQCRLFNVPYILSLHGGNLPHRIISSKRMARQLFANSNKNVAVSGYLKNCMDQHNWQCTTIPNPIQLNYYSFLLRMECRPKLLWVRSFHELYNPQLAIKILSHLKIKYPNATLTMVGPAKDDSFEICKQLAKDLNIENDVLFTGLLSKEQWIALSRDYDFFINTTNFDNQPVSVIEAMALGMIVISTNVGGLKYIIDNGTNGVLLSPNNATAFSNMIASLIENPTEQKRISKAARETAEEYDWSYILQKWNALFNDIN
jgi:glycosyltransferase involved in cell wall biosynthesis